MTRSGFLNDVTDWADLISFCIEQDCVVCEDIYYEEDAYEQIDDGLREYVYHNTWQEVRNMLNNIETGFDFYRRDGTMEYTGLDDYSDFRDYKDAVLEWMDGGGYWDEEEEEEEECPDSLDSDTEAEEGQSPMGEEDFSVSELFGMCFASMTAIKQKETEREEEEKMSTEQKIEELTNTFKQIGQ